MLTLADVVSGGQEGVKYRQDQEELTRQKAARDTEQQANEAAARAYREAMGAAGAPGLSNAPPAAPATQLGQAPAPAQSFPVVSSGPRVPGLGDVPQAGGAPAGPSLAEAGHAPQAGAAPASKQAAPSGAPNQGQAIIAAYKARGEHFAKAGDWANFTKNYAQIAPLRTQMRNETMQKAMQQYQVDGDVGKLAQTAFNAVDTGKQVQQVLVEGDKYRFVLDDGTTTPPTTKDKLIESVQRMQLDPAKTAEFEFEQQIKLAMAQAKATAEGAEARSTEGVKHRNKVEQIGLENAGAMDVAKERTRGQVTAAKIGANSREAVATTRSTGPDGGPRVQKTIIGNDGYVVNVFKDGSSKRLTLDGKPVRASEYAKRVDSLVNQMRKSSSGFGKSEAELRSAAEESLAGGAGVQSQDPKPATTDFSKLWN